jgi:NTE family protein
LVLAGGGAKGAFEAGAYRRILEEDITFKVIAGVSVGALNGAMIAMDKFEELEDIWFTWTNKNVYRGKLGFGALFRILIQKKRSIFDNTPLYKAIQKITDWDALKIPFLFGSVDLDSGSYLRWECVPGELQYTKEILDLALLSSGTMPVIWEPIKIPELGYWDLVDGGLRNLTPVGDILEYQPNLVVIVTCQPLTMPPAGGRVGDIVKVLNRTIGIMTDEIMHNDIRHFEDKNRLVRQSNGTPLVDSRGRKFEEYQSLIIAPPFDLGDSLNFDPEIAKKRYDLGYRSADLAIRRWQTG